MVCLAVTYVVLPNREEEALGLFARLTEATRAEPGCRFYQVHRSPEDPRHFFLYEQYVDDAALAAHRSSPALRGVRAAGIVPDHREPHPARLDAAGLPCPRAVSATSLTVDLPEAQTELAESLLWDAGATGLEIRNREAPPMPGVRGPAPGEAVVVAWFEGPSAAEAALGMLREAVAPLRAEIEEAPDTDWSTAWRARIRSTRVGRLWVGPPWETPPVGDGGPDHRAEDGLRHRRPSDHRALSRCGRCLLRDGRRVPRCSTWGPGPACWR